MAKTSPLQRTLKFLRDDGFIVGITEKFNPHVKIRQDFCGFADCIAFKVGEPVLAVNAMLLRNRNVHDRFDENDALKTWVDAGHRFEMHQWHIVGARGKRKTWELVRFARTEFGWAEVLG